MGITLYVVFMIWIIRMSIKQCESGNRRKW